MSEEFKQFDGMDLEELKANKASYMKAFQDSDNKFLKKEYKKQYRANRKKFKERKKSE